MIDLRIKIIKDNESVELNLAELQELHGMLDSLSETTTPIEAEVDF